MILQVRDGLQPVEERDCRLVLLADGRKAAVWRGLAFPLLPDGNAIDVSGDGHSPALGRSFRPASPRGIVIDGEGGAYVVLAASLIETEEFAAELRRRGAEVLRTGRYFGEAVEGLEADWFIRLGSGGDIARLMLSSSPAGELENIAEPAEIRLRLLTNELRSLHTRLAAEMNASEKLRATITAGASSSADRDMLRLALDGERSQREALEQQLAELDLRLSTTTPAPVAETAKPRRPQALQREVETVLAQMLPRIRLVRGCIEELMFAFSDRADAYRTLQDLQLCQTAMPERWKSVQGCQGWIEKSKVGNGRDSQGRIYARLDRTDRYWDVLIGHKSEQTRDMSWLKTT